MGGLHRFEVPGYYKDGYDADEVDALLETKDKHIAELEALLRETDASEAAGQSVEGVED